MIKLGIRSGLKKLSAKIGSIKNKRMKGLEKIQDSRDWFNRKSRSIALLFEYPQMKDFVFSRFSELWARGDKTKDEQVYAIITQVALANAVLAGLPGKLGIGVIICIALEFYMALSIARRIGFKISEEDLWSKFKDLSRIGAYFTFVGFIALFAFRHMLGFVFSLIPGVLPQMVIAEYIVTTFVGVLFFQAYEQFNGKTFFPDKLIRSSASKAKELFLFQKDAIKSAFSKENIQESGSKVRAWFSGDFIENIPKVRGDVFFSISFSCLLKGNESALKGPLGVIFLDSIRQRWPELAGASISEISAKMNTYSQDQIPGVLNTIKGKFFENLVEYHENNDGDQWTAMLHKDESYPGSDIVLTNMENGEILEISLKATDDQGYIENALLRYPEIPILSTSDVAINFDELDQVIASEFSNQELKEITETNFEEILNLLPSVPTKSLAASTAIGVAMAAVVALWPFVIAYVRKKIDLQMLQRALTKVYPQAGKELAYRLTFSTILGPIYGWYVLASTVMELVPSQKSEKPVKYLKYNKPKN